MAATVLALEATLLTNDYRSLALSDMSTGGMSPCSPYRCSTIDSFCPPIGTPLNFSGSNTVNDWPVEKQGSPF